MIRGEIGVIGASGFIGNRLIERLVLEQSAEVKAVVRSVSSYSRPARFNIKIEVGDLLDLESLCKAFNGCSIVFHTAVGDSRTIIKGIENTLLAAAKVGVRRIVYLSSAVVHGYNPAPSTNEDSALVKNQPFEYSNSKVKAEFIIREMRRRLPVEVVVLRPYIVYGPGATYNTTLIVQKLLQREICLIDNGQAAFNGVYVDNLIDSMLLAAEKPEAANQDFIIGDGFNVTWSDYFSALCEVIGVTIDDILSLTRQEATTLLKERNKRESFRKVLANLVTTKEFRLFVLSLAGARPLINWSRPAIRSVLNKLKSNSSSGEGDTNKFSNLQLDEEWIALMSCQTYLPIEKAKSVLGYQAKVNFEEAMKRTGEYLRFACLLQPNILKANMR